MIVMIDNYDSFTFNLVDYIGTIATKDINVFRNDKVSIDDIEALSPTQLIISPGPKSPSEAGISESVIKHFYKSVPILGVCLGHQAIGQVFGGEIVQAQNLMHGKTSQIQYTSDDTVLFKDLPNPFTATRYHSLVIKKGSIDDSDLISFAYSTDDEEIMAVKHKDYPVYGVQFHPESILTETGIQMLVNFLRN